MKKQILIISIISLFAILLFAEQKPQKITPEENCPIIDQFPNAFKRYNENNTICKNRISRMSRIERWNLEEQFSKEFINDYAASFVSIKMHYSTIDNSGLFFRYIRNYGKLGDFGRVIQNLGYPYNYFLPSCHGFVLVEAIKDTVLDRIHTPPPSTINKRVMIAKIIDDLFDTIEQDTIYVYHDFNLKDSIFIKYNKPKLLFGISGGGTAILNDTIINTYMMNGTSIPFIRDQFKSVQLHSTGRYEHAFVVNDTIKDPNHVYDFDTYSYEDFKIQFLTDVKNAGIRK